MQDDYKRKKEKRCYFFFLVSRRNFGLARNRLFFWTAFWFGRWFATHAVFDSPCHALKQHAFQRRSDFFFFPFNVF